LPRRFNFLQNQKELRRFNLGCKENKKSNFRKTAKKTIFSIKLTKNPQKRRKSSGEFGNLPEKYSKQYLFSGESIHSSGFTGNLPEFSQSTLLKI